MAKNLDWKLVRTTPRKRYYVSAGGLVRVENRKDGKSTVSRGTLNEATGYLFVRGWYVHRLVAEAFLGEQPDGADQVDHLNDVRTDNRASNLRWTTRRENNSKWHARRERRRNAGTGRPSRVAATWPATGERHVFETGRACAEWLGCSHVLVYNCLNRRGSARRAFGWTLERA